MEELRILLESITQDFTKDELDVRFPNIAKFIMTNYGINAKGMIYLLNEIEFYFYDHQYDDKRLGNGKSRITYERTTLSGSWYIHDYEVDLTFKSDAKMGYGGGFLYVL